jgi:hypothetical protein
MKNYIIATVKATFYNVEKQVPVAPAQPMDQAEWDENVVTETVFQNVVEEFHSLPRRNTTAAMEEAKWLALRKGWSMRRNDYEIEIEELPTKAVAVYEEEDLVKLYQGNKVEKFALLQTLVPGQEIKSYTKRYWMLNPQTFEPVRTTVTMYKEGNINPDFENEEGTGKWYYLNEEECLFTGDESCRKHINKHRNIWLF